MRHVPTRLGYSRLVLVVAFVIVVKTLWAFSGRWRHRLQTDPVPRLYRCLHLEILRRLHQRAVPSQIFHVARRLVEGHFAKHRSTGICRCIDERLPVRFIRRPMRRSLIAATSATVPPPADLSDTGAARRSDESVGPTYPPTIPTATNDRTATATRLPDMAVLLLRNLQECATRKGNVEPRPRGYVLQNHKDKCRKACYVAGKVKSTFCPCSMMTLITRNS